MRERSIRSRFPVRTLYGAVCISILLWGLLMLPTRFCAAQAVALVDDQAGLLSQAERSEIEAQAASLSEEAGWDVMVISTEDAQGKTSEAFADDYYDEHCTQEDGVAVLIDMDNRNYYVSTSGIAIRYVTDDRLEELLDHAYDDMRSGDYAQAYLSMLDDLGEFYQEGIYADQYNYDTQTGEISYYRNRQITSFELGLALLLGLLSAGGVFFVVKGRYQMKIGRYHYIWQQNIHADISRRSDRFVNRMVTRRHIRRDPPGGGGGGGHMSSTHTSSGGGSHGGGGRGF